MRTDECTWPLCFMHTRNFIQNEICSHWKKTKVFALSHCHKMFDVLKITYLLTYLLTYLPTYLLHGAGYSFNS